MGGELGGRSRPWRLLRGGERRTAVPAPGSTHVADLERALGLRFFDRTRQPVVLTPEGRALLPHARAVLRKIASLGSVAAEARQGLHREVRLGVDPSAAPFLCRG